MLRIHLPFIAAIMALDQLSKWLLLGVMETRNCRLIDGLPHLCDPVPVLPFFDLVMVWNRGVSFGLFSSGGEGGQYILAAVNIAVAAGLAVWLSRTDTRLVRIALVLVIGGAIGNAIDRFVWGAVADFFDVYLTGAAGAWVAGWAGTSHWPAFNIADIAISAGVVGLIVDSLFGGRESTRKAS